MPLRYSSLFSSLAALLVLTGCAGEPIPEVPKGQYWQRVNTSESVYMQGPKAQQLLNRSIARCVVELREFERLGMVRNAIPADVSGRVLDPDQLDPDEIQMDDWDTPERDGVLFAEHFDYQDFEGCMLAKGWERIKYVPYDVQLRSRQTYLESQVGYAYETNYAEKAKRRRGIPSSAESGDFSQLND